MLYATLCSSDVFTESWWFSIGVIFINCKYFMLNVLHFGIYMWLALFKNLYHSGCNKCILDNLQYSYRHQLTLMRKNKHVFWLINGPGVSKWLVHAIQSFYFQVNTSLIYVYITIVLYPFDNNNNLKMYLKITF